MMYRLDLSTIPPLFDRLVGDYNFDGVVDAADYTVWRNTLGSTTDLRANGDNSGGSFSVVDEADFLAWKNNYGAVANGRGTGSAATAPEPTGLLLAVVAVVLILVEKTMRRSSRTPADCRTTTRSDAVASPTL